MENSDKIKIQLAELEAALLKEAPFIPTALRAIHTTLKNDPAIVTLLSPEDKNIIIRGLEKQTATYLAASVNKTSVSKTKAASKLTEADLGFD